MDEQDLQNFEKFVEEFSRASRDPKAAQGLGHLMAVQRQLQSSKVDLEDDAVYATNKNGGLGIVRDMKVELGEADDSTFMPLIEGLRRSTLNVRLKNTFRDIIDPLSSELMAQQYERMSHDLELHREDTSYYRQIIAAIEALGKTNRSNFFDSILTAGRRFQRNPIWTSLEWTLDALRFTVFKPLMGILTGFKRKTDTQRIVEAINQQTEYMRTGKIEPRGILDAFRYGGLFGVIGDSMKNTFREIFPQEGILSPQEAMHQTLLEMLELDKERNSLLSKSIGDVRSPTVMKAAAANDEIIDQLKVANGSFVQMTKQEDDSGTILSELRDFQNMTLEQQKNTTEELEDHNKREQRRSLFSILKTALPGILGIGTIAAGLGGAWFMSPDSARETIGGGVDFGLSSLGDWVGWGNLIGAGLMLSPFGLKIKAIGASVAILSNIHNWLNKKFGTSKEDEEAERDARINPSAGLGGRLRGDQEELKERLEWLERDQETIKGLEGKDKEYVQKWIDENKKRINELRESGVELPRDSSSSGLGFVAEKEGFRKNAYKDDAGVWTIGYGSTQMNGRPVQAGDKVTEEQAMEMFRNDYNKRRSMIEKMVSVPLKEHQLDALTSFAYNVGMDAFKNSNLLKKLNSGNFSAAAGEFTNWNKITDPLTGSKVVSQGLSNRRQEEMEMFRGTGRSQVSVNETSNRATPSISDQAISAAGQVSGIPTQPQGRGRIDEMILEYLKKIAENTGMDSGGFLGASDVGTSHAAYGD